MPMTEGRRSRRLLALVELADGDREIRASWLTEREIFEEQPEQSFSLNRTRTNRRTAPANESGPVVECELVTHILPRKGPDINDQ